MNQNTESVVIVSEPHWVQVAAEVAAFWAVDLLTAGVIVGVTNRRLAKISAVHWSLWATYTGPSHGKLTLNEPSITEPSAIDSYIY